jgi:GNAT superfamily N-acetyltransferase
MTRAAAAPDPDFPYAIRNQGEADEAALLDLLRITVGETSASRKTTEFWRWKHVDNPFGPSYSVCAWDEATGQLAGLRTLMRWAFRGLDDTTHLAARPVDTATHPDHQRRGVFSALTRFSVEQVSAGETRFIFNTPNANSLGGYLKMGWSEVARWPLFMRPVRWLRCGSALLSREAEGASETDSVAGNGSVPRGMGAWRDLVNGRRAEVAALIAANEAGRARVGYRTARSVEYMDWRYGAHPGIAYGVHEVSDARGLSGVAVAREVGGMAGLRALLVVELLLREPSPRNAARLVKRLIRTTESDYLVAHFSAGTFERQALLRNGFIPVPGKEYTFVARGLDPVTPDPTRATSWDLTLGELEIF